MFITIAPNDFNIKIKNAKRLLDKSNDVTITLKIKGRYNEKQDLIDEFVNRIKTSLSEYKLISESSKSNNHHFLYR